MATDIKLFENKKIRSHYEDTEKWYLSAIDIIEILTESKDARTYWKVLKKPFKQRRKRNGYKL